MFNPKHTSRLVTDGQTPDLYIRPMHTDVDLDPAVVFMKISSIGVNLAATAGALHF